MENRQVSSHQLINYSTTICMRGGKRNDTRLFCFLSNQWFKFNASFFELNCQFLRILSNYI